MSSVEFIGPTKTLSTELEPYIKNPELIPNQVEIGFVYEEMQKAIEKLFEITPRDSFASFTPPAMFSLKRLFKENLIPNLDIDAAIRRVDIYIEENNIEEKQEEDILAMLFKIIDLNNQLVEIRTRMQEILKS